MLLLPLFENSWFFTDYLWLYQILYARLPDCETETNPIDRTVAHLLFHIPVELSGKQLESSESPLSTKLPSEHRAAETIINLPETFINKRCFGHQESKVCSPILLEPDQYKDGPCVDASANASNNGLADGGAVVAAVESSQWTKTYYPVINNKGNSFLNVYLLLKLFHLHGFTDLPVMWSILLLSANWVLSFCAVSGAWKGQTLPQWSLWH